MKKFLLFIILFFTLSITANASTGTVICTNGDTSPLRVRKSIDSTTAAGWLNCNSTVEVLDENAGSNDACSKWYEVKQGDITGYSCGEYITINKIVQNLKGKVACFENDDPLSVRKTINGTKVTTLSCDKEMTILDDSLGKSGSCDNWYKVSYGNDKIGYVCGTYVVTYVDVDYNDENIKQYRDSLKTAGFPESYLDALVKLHVQYPSWNFIPFDTNLKWNTVIDNESVKNRNLIYKSYGIGYRSTESYSYNWGTDEYYKHPTEVNWWYASRDAVEYYMDPRNYLNSKNIFSFETLSYEPTFQTTDVVDKIMGNSFMPDLYKKYSTTPYLKAFTVAAERYGVSPVHLASRIIQEQGINGSIASLGEKFTYNGKSYSGFFNFYNIKATGENPAIQGLVWAMGGVNGTGTSYGRPWNTPYRGIVGGARFISEDYISIGQNTLYFQKFDVSRDDGHYSHQYMQNITAQITEGIDAYTGYSNIKGIFDEPLVFIIPVYDNMPEEVVKAPVNKSPNSYLSSIKIDDKKIEGFKYNKLNYNIDVTSSIDSIKLTATPVNDNAKTNGTGEIKLNDGENIINIKVTAENGNISTYKLTINKQVKEEDIVLSNTNNLKSVTIDKIKFDFNKDILEYNLETDYSTSKISISYETEDSSSVVDAVNTVNLVVGINKITIKVTAENGEEKIYIFNITRNSATIKEVLNKSGVKYNDKYIYGIKLNTKVDSLIENIKKVNNSISVVIKNKDNKAKTGTFATGDKVIINDGTNSSTYQIVIYGDVNGDSKIDKLDYLAVLRHYYKYKTYTGVYKESADVNRDDKVDKLDYLAILRDYYNYKKIEQ